ncbi:MAG: hypothetical protein RPT25_04575 [Cycloclasticus sp.]|jgi:hypothetical protein
MARYKNEQKLDYVRQASQAAVQDIVKNAGVSESVAQDWIKNFWGVIRRPDSYGKLCREKNELKIKKSDFNKLEQERDFYKQLLLDGCTQYRKRRREIAQKAVNRYGHSKRRACQLMNISEGYYRSGDDE